MKNVFKTIIEDYPIVLTVIGVLVVLAAIYYGWMAAIATAIAMIVAAAVEVLVVFGVYYGVKILIEWIGEKKNSQKRGA